MKKLLVVVDMQNDFINGSLGSAEAEAIVPSVAKKIKEWDGDVVMTVDEHYYDYEKTQEGRKLPVKHCIYDTIGWQIHSEVAGATEKIVPKFIKNTFGSVRLGQHIASEGYTHVEFVGLCTDVCVISNAMLAKAFAPETTIVVDASCCAGVTQESHKTAMNAMKACQIEVINEDGETPCF